MKFYSLLLCLFISLQGCSQPTPSEKESLIVYGDNFSFSVKEPFDWKGDIDNAARNYANIIFYKNEESLKSGGALVQVYIFKKLDENTKKDLTSDVSRYENEYKNLKKHNFKAEHPDYACYSKMVSINNETYQYLTYINPGPNFKNGVSISMNISGRKASKEEVEAYRMIIQSFLMLT